MSEEPTPVSSFDETGHAEDSFERDIAAVLCSPVPAALRPGQVIAERYRIVDTLGRGGMGAVYRARHIATDGPVALKVMSVTTDESARRFEVEARNAAALSHPNTVRVVDFGTDGALHYLVMELVDGASLRSMLRRDGPLLWSRVAALARQVLAALVAAHEHELGIVHRDIKPANIVVTEDLADHVKVVDFGVSRALFGDGAATMGIVGTPAYLAPEVWQGEPCDARTDLYALGCTVYELLSGESPFRAQFPGALGYKHLHEPAPELGALRDDVPEWASEWVAWLMAKDPEERPASARQAVEALDSRTVPHRRATPAAPITVVGERVVPERTTRFVGRESELEALAAALRSSRLVTLLGPGGAGKTRLVQEFGRDLGQKWPGGVYFCDLVEARDVLTICDAVAATLGLALRGDPVSHVGTVIAARPEVLLLLDNFEQVVGDASATVGRWLELAPNASFVVTSRERLHLGGEHVLTLGPLGLPEAGATSRREIGGADAVQLFVSRAQSTNVEFDLSDDVAADVAALVRALDGLPLAIELAARRARVLSPSGILSHLRQRFRLLRSRERGGDPRQLTMWAAIDWSWDLLEPWEQAVLAQCSVFHGGFTLEAAEAIVDVSPWSEAPWVLDIIDSLVDKSCLVSGAARQGDGSPRFGMYIAIREFGQVQLARQGWDQGLRRRHAEYFSSFVPPPPAFVPTAGYRVVRRIEAEEDNIFSAIAYTMEALEGAPDSEREGLASCGARLALLASALHVHTGSGRVVGVLAALYERYADLLGQSTLLDLALARGYLNGMVAGVAESARWFEQALVDARRLGDRRAEVRALRNLSIVALYAGDTEKLVAWGEEALALVAEIDDPLLDCLVRRTVAHVRLGSGCIDEARRLMTDALAAATELGELGIEAMAACELAQFEMACGQLSSAEALLLRSLEVIEQLRHRLYEGVVHTQLADLRCDQGRREEAYQHVNHALRVNLEQNSPFQRAWAQNAMARLLLSEGRFDRALSIARKVDRVGAQFDVRDFRIDALISVSRALVGLAQREQARQALETARQLAAGSRIGRLEVRLVAVELGLDVGDEDDLVLLLGYGSRIEGRRARARGVLALRRGHLAEARDHLADSERLLRATECALEITETRLERVAVEMAAGQYQLAGALFSHVTGLCEIAPRSRLGVRMAQIWTALAQQRGAESPRPSV